MEIHLTESNINRVITGLKAQHRHLGKKIENSQKSGNFRSYQRQRKRIRSLAIEKFNADRKKVYDWE